MIDWVTEYIAWGIIWGIMAVAGWITWASIAYHEERRIRRIRRERKERQ